MVTLDPKLSTKNACHLALSTDAGLQPRNTPVEAFRLGPVQTCMVCILYSIILPNYEFQITKSFTENFPSKSFFYLEKKTKEK